MKIRQHTRSNRISESRDHPLRVGAYLSRLADEAQMKLAENCEPDEAEYSRWQMRLVDTLQPYSDVPFSELEHILNRETKPNRSMEASRPFEQHSEHSNRSSRRTKSATEKRRSPKAILPHDLESLDQDGVEEILENTNYTKFQLAELGFRRFGISRPSLIRSRKDEAVMSIRTAIKNERALEIISQVAGDAAKERAN